MVSVIIVVYNKYIIKNLTYIIGIQVKLTNCTLRLVLYYSSKSIVGFPDSSVGKESVCSTGHPGSIPGLGRSHGEGKGYPLQYSWASLVAQVVKNLSAMQETRVQSLGWKGPMEKAKATHSSVLAWGIPWVV